eukprot:CAMPEP_0114986090 /NCGR_PEP_ID=MMETSP0216-20121206/8239_1 /TAXON_ID=223996 /ORGANISM="Protocruzia adherens, Strain Boccale" /LENGTH=547 /DNA_ID=CAMNT_0002348499 /DNA_START=32 /DNA_END=1675 /DNA_ORIENTATION=-
MADDAAVAQLKTKVETISKDVATNKKDITSAKGDLKEKASATDFKGLKTTVESQGENIEKVQNKQNTLEEDVKGVKTTLTDLESTADTLKTDVASHKESSVEKSTFETLNETVSALVSRVDALETSLKEKEEKIGSLETSLTEKEEKIQALEKTVETHGTEITDLKSKFTSFEEDLKNKNYDGKIEDINNSIQSVRQAYLTKEDGTTEINTTLESRLAALMLTNRSVISQVITDDTKSSFEDVNTKVTTLSKQTDQKLKTTRSEIDTDVRMMIDSNAKSISSKLQNSMRADAYQRIEECYKGGVPRKELIHDFMIDQKKIVNLDLHGAKIGEYPLQWAEIFVYIKELESMYLDDNDLDDEGGSKIWRAFEAVTNLKEIHTEKNALGPTAAGAINQVLEANAETLSKVLMGENHFETSGMEVLAPGLSQCTKLTFLSIHHNGLQDSGIALLAKSLENVSQLKHLYIEGNNITIEGAKSMEPVLKNNTSLSVVKMHKNSLEMDGVSYILDLFQKGYELRELWLGSNKVPMSQFGELEKKKTSCHGTCFL